MAMNRNLQYLNIEVHYTAYHKQLSFRELCGAKQVPTLMIPMASQITSNSAVCSTVNTWRQERNIKAQQNRPFARWKASPVCHDAIMLRQFIP